jgi:hypothetical protein
LTIALTYTSWRRTWVSVMLSMTLAKSGSGRAPSTGAFRLRPRGCWLVGRPRLGQRERLRRGFEADDRDDGFRDDEAARIDDGDLDPALARGLGVYR